MTEDTHENFTRLNTENFSEQKDMAKDDIVIICGDFGMWDGSKHEQYWMRWLDEKPYTTLFVDEKFTLFYEQIVRIL